MWDEQERFAKAVIRVLAWALLALGIASVAASVAAGTPAFLVACLQFVGLLGAAWLAYALLAVGVVAPLVGLGHLLIRLGRWIAGVVVRGHRTV
jgi:hypothetical protein